MSDLTRREALALAGACACCAMSAVEADAYDNGPAIPPSPSGPAKALAVGKLADYAKPGFYDKFKANKVLVARLDDRLVVMSNVCTHKGCSVRIQPDHHDALRCPCHKAEFSDQGTPTAGPARTALTRYAVKQNADGTLTADLTRSFIESKWDDADAFIPLKPAAAPAGG